MNETLRAVGYIRVSSKEQATKGESLSTQRKAIRDFTQGKGWGLAEIYADEGISGGTVAAREELKRLLEDARRGRFNVVVTHRLSRFGRNARELLNNVAELDKAEVQFTSIKEQIDFGTAYGRAMLTMLSAIAELERDIIREQAVENRIARAKKGFPTSGRLPFARKFDRKTGEWSLDEPKAELIRWAAEEYLKGGSLHDLSDILRERHKLPLGYHYLTDILKNKSGDTWTMNFRGEEPIEFRIPRILPPETIEAIRERLTHNRTFNRKDARKYALTGFIRCYNCGKALAGQTQVNRTGKEYPYYRHPGGKREPCRRSFNSVPLAVIEDAVFRTIFEFVGDRSAFLEAIKGSLPDTEYIEKLNKRKSTLEKEVARLDREVDRLVDAVADGSLPKKVVAGKIEEKTASRDSAAGELEKVRREISTLPDPEQVQREAEAIRKDLFQKFRSEEHLKSMTYDDKVRLMHYLFSGTVDGAPCGIYVRRLAGKKGAGRQKPLWDYRIIGRFLDEWRTIKGDDINYTFDDLSRRMRGKINRKRLESSENKNRRYFFKTDSLRRVHHHDLHPRPQPARCRRAQPG